MDDKISLPLSTELLVAEAAAAHRTELRRLNDIAFAFLSATNGDQAAAENLLDDCIDLLFEAGALQLWRYRHVLSAIHKGL